MKTESEQLKETCVKIIFAGIFSGVSTKKWTISCGIKEPKAANFSLNESPEASSQAFVMSLIEKQLEVKSFADDSVKATIEVLVDVDLFYIFDIKDEVLRVYNPFNKDVGEKLKKVTLSISSTDFLIRFILRNIMKSKIKRKKVLKK